jgi:diaminopimelate epimerase
MSEIKIIKMNGSGNDFVMIDHREGQFEARLKDLASQICHRRFGVGADGLILIESSDIVDFKMRIINADGSEAEMCGNGARCAVLFARDLGIVSESMMFETLAGVLGAEILDQDVVCIQMSNPLDRKDHVEIEDKGRLWDISYLNTGVPHAIIFVENVDKADLLGMGRLLRYHDYFQPEGTNVNILQVIDDSAIKIRTYERGVEDETFACGTGAVAAAIMAHVVKGLSKPMTVMVKGGQLKIDFEVHGDVIKNVTMEGSADKVFEGTFLL